VDGATFSMGTFILVFADEAEALEVSKIHLHRADMYINTPEDQAFLDSVNKDLRAKLALKIDEAKLKDLKGVTLDELFDPTKRIEVQLSAKEAKAIGLIDKIVKLNPAEITAFNNYFKIAAEQSATPIEQPKKTEIPKPNKVMTKEELKAQHPAVYAEITAQAEKAAAEKERERVEAWMQFADVDAEAVNKGISEGKELSIKAMAEFTRKGMSANALKNLETNSPVAVKTAEVTEKEKTDKEKSVSAFEAETMAAFGLTTNPK
jgi:hypothetical protein